MNGSSIRVRLTIWYSVVLGLGLLLLGIFVWTAMRHQTMADIDADIRTRTQGLEKYLRTEEAEDPATLAHELGELHGTLPANYEEEVLSPEGRSIFATDEAEAIFSSTRQSVASHSSKRTEFWRQMDWRGKHYRLQAHLAVLTGHEYWTLVAATTDQALHTVSQLAFFLFAGIPGVVLIAACGGYWLSGRALSPVAALTNSARLIGVEDLSKRLPVPASGDEVQHLAETWNDMLARLEIAVARISQFTSDASHELRTPIALIRSTAEIALRRDRSETQYREALEQIEMESERMTQLVSDLLFLARADQPAISAEMTKVDLRRPLTAACEEIAPFASKCDIDIDAGVYPDSILVVGHESALRRMLVALLENAVKYTPRNGRVTVSLETADTAMTLTVCDTGVGIPASALPHVFERFFRADPSRNRESGGYGLGLSIAQTIAHQHHGVIEVESQIGVGSVFRVTLPLAVDATTRSSHKG